MTECQLGPARPGDQCRQHDPVAHPSEPLRLGHLVERGAHPLRGAVQQPGQVGGMGGRVRLGGWLRVPEGYPRLQYFLGPDILVSDQVAGGLNRRTGGVLRP